MALSRDADHVGGRDREGRILKRTVIDPMQRHGLWDALASEFEAMPWGEVNCPGSMPPCGFPRRATGDPAG